MPYSIQPFANRDHYSAFAPSYAPAPLVTGLSLSSVFRPPIRAPLERVQAYFSSSNKLHACLRVLAAPGFCYSKQAVHVAGMC